LTEVVIVDWEDSGLAASAAGALAPTLARLCALGVDIVLVCEGDGSWTGPDAGSVEAGATAGWLDPLSATAGPGRVFLWSGRPSEVTRLGGEESGEVLRQPVAGECPLQWAQRRLTGPGRAVAVADSRHPSVESLTAMAADLCGVASPVADPEWTIEVDGSTPSRERSVESWFTVANGRTGTRGTSEEGRVGEYPGTYVAGVFGRNLEESIPELIRGPEWPRLWTTGDGGAPADADTERRVLDMRQGMFTRRWGRGTGDVTPRADARPGQGASVPESGRSFRSARLASLADRAITFIEAERFGGHEPGPAVAPATVPGDQTAVEAVRAQREGDVVSVTVTGRGGGEATFAVSTHQDGARVSRLTAVERNGASGSPAGVSESMAAAAVAGARSLGADGVKARHRSAWRQRWRDSDVVVEGDSGAQRALRFSLYHLISSGDPESDLASIGARGLSGPGYRGHVFWDTEVFVLPFFIWTHPATARALLAYRHRTLPAARDKARVMGYSGALFAWESADNGEECTPDWITLPSGVRLGVHTGAEEHHISADVAWAVWEYWKVTGDDRFLVDMGAEIILETARFWASRAVTGDDSRHHIRGVIGPDEYHEHVDDNAFTNAMARWNLRLAARLCDLVPSLDATGWQALVRRIRLDPGEASRWIGVEGSLVDGFDSDTSVYEQFAGFHKLEPVRAVDLAPRPFTGEAILGLERLRESQLVKQADVVMLVHMLAGEIPPGVAAANYRHYEPLTCHGSSLSPAIHAVVAARAGALEHAAGYFSMASGIDLDDRMGNASEGIHIATMGGLWQAAVLGFGGVSADGDVVRIDPRLPSEWDSLAFSVRWRGTGIDVTAETDRIHVDLDGTVNLAIGSGPPAELGPGRFVASIVVQDNRVPEWRIE